MHSSANLPASRCARRALLLALTVAGCDPGANKAGPSDASTRDAAVSDAGVACVPDALDAQPAPTTSCSNAAPPHCFADAGDASSDAACPDASPPCPSTPSDSHQSERAACAFEAGASTEETLGITRELRALLPIEHVIVVMKENRSYDHLFGKLHDRGQPDAEPIPADFYNLDLAGNRVYPQHADTTCLHYDQEHGWNGMHAQVDGGAMDGFVTSAANSSGGDGHYALSYYDASDLPFYYFLGNTFAIADRYFASVRGPTWPNRDYLLLGTSDGVNSTHGGLPSPSLPTVFSELDARGVSWGVYAPGEPFEGSLGWAPGHPNVSTVDDFLKRLADGTLPHVTFVDGRENVEDEHPKADVQVGEAWTRTIYETARTSPLWQKLAILYTYDEGGGYFDHVPPPNHTCIARPQDKAFFELGVRVPLIVISAWARKHYVSHVQHQHTSILRFIEAVFDLPALTARDANSDALLDMFDFRCGAVTPLPPAPAAGTGGCH